MEGKVKVSYQMLCESDVEKEVSLEALLENEKVAKVIKSEFAKGLRNIELSTLTDAKIALRTHKEVFEFEAQKSDFADLIELAEEDAKANKRNKKGCSGIELVDFETL